MRLGKRKEKEHQELKSQDVEGITRLICLSKGQNPLKGICKLLNHLLSLLVILKLFMQALNTKTYINFLFQFTLTDLSGVALSFSNSHLNGRPILNIFRLQFSSQEYKYSYAARLFNIW